MAIHPASMPPAMRQNKKALTSFLESETVELKLDYTDSIRKDIIAFANTSGGIIYIGIADDSTVVGVSSAGHDETSSVCHVLYFSPDGDLSDLLLLEK